MRERSDMYRHQEAVATELYERNVYAVVPMGGGKTCSQLTAIRDLINDGEIRCALGVAPKKVAQLVWPREVAEWEHLKDLHVCHVSGTPAQRLAKLMSDADVYIVGIDNTQWLVEQLDKLPADHKLFDYFFVDEGSRFRNPRGKRYKALRKLMGRFRQVTLLTGTPRPKGWEDLFAPLLLVSRGRLWGKSFDRWRQTRFMPMDYFGHTWSIRPEWRERTLEEAKPWMVTISDSDMPDIPELVPPIIHWVELPPTARKIYKDMERKLLAPMKEGNVLAANAAVASGKLAQIASGFIYHEDKSAEPIHSEKADMLVELTEDLDESVLIAYEFREELRVLREMYPGLPYLGAGVDDVKVAWHERGWNTRHESYRYMALHPASAGHGLNLQKGGRRIVWFGMTWSAELYDQTVKRIHRPGQTEKVFNHLILARDTVDQIKFDRVVNRMSEQEAFRKYLETV